MQGIFISYRRQDSQNTAGALVDHLAGNVFGVPIFQDVGSSEPGVDFVDAIEHALQSCSLLLAIIGPRWASLTDAAGRRRLDDPNDCMRVEIATAFRKNIQVIPVLLKGARLPAADDLPDELKPLLRCNAIVLGDEHGKLDAARLDQCLSWFQPPNVASTRAAAPSLFQRLKRGFAFWRDKEADAPDFRGPDTRIPLPKSGPTFGNSSPATAGAEPPDTDPWPVGVPTPMAEPPRMRDDEPATVCPAPAPAAPAETTPEPVHLGASAPRAVKPGDEFTARFVAYVAAFETTMRDTLARLSPRAESHLGLKTCQWRRGSQLTVRLAARGLQVAPAEQGFVWDGEQAMVEFDVSVPEASPEGVVVLKFDVLMDGITVAMLRLDLEIAASASAEMAEAGGGASRTAFASYSSNDRQRVLDRVDAVRIAAGLDIFLDCLSLHPGEQWKERLDREIPARDLFMLFWSAEAAKSQWVEWEWRRALALKGLDAMQIHPLENGVKPPQELDNLHFGSVAMYARGTDGD